MRTIGYNVAQQCLRVRCCITPPHHSHFIHSRHFTSKPPDYLYIYLPLLTSIIKRLRTMSTVPNPPNLRPQIATFFTSSHYALSGASPDPSKYGHRLYKWYLSHKLPCIPINPRNPPPQIHPSQPAEYPTVPTLSSLPKEYVEKAGGWGGLSLSIVTPPKATLETLREARGVGIRRVWMQPGSWNMACVEEAQRGTGEVEQGFEVVIYGGEGKGEMEPGMEEGWCVLVHGEEGMKAAKEVKGRL
ncbi:CoA binding domain-containing protein [Kalaharituber pfeilii]|nr:CoA binding domain-containing protein [Kalaharituber pfeilii]